MEIKHGLCGGGGEGEGVGVQDSSWYIGYLMWEFKMFFYFLLPADYVIEIKHLFLGAQSWFRPKPEISNDLAKTGNSSL